VFGKVDTFWTYQLIVSLLLFSVTSQHNIPHTSLDTDGGGGGYTNLLHLWLREARRRSTPSPGEGGATKVFFNYGLVLQIRGGSLKW
jgi:hypothetical protein